MAHVTVPATDPMIEYTAGTNQTAFDIPAFIVWFQASDLRVFVSGVELAADAWSAVGNVDFDGGFAGGVLTLDVGVTAVPVEIYRSTTLGRSTDFAEGAPVPRSVLNTAIDQIEAKIVDAFWRNRRTLRAEDWAPPVNPLSDPLNPTAILQTPATLAQALAGTDNAAYMTALRARQGMKQAALIPDVDTDGFYDGVSGAGFFADYNCLGGVRWRVEQDEDQSGIAGGGFRDALFVNHIDNDTVNYTAIGQKVSYGIRSLVTGAFNGTGFDTQYKDLVAGDFHAIGDIGWNDRGVSGIAAGAVQYGTGIASNEFSVENPASAPSQSVSMAAVQGIVRPYKAADGGGASYSAFLATNTGHRATAAFRAVTAPISGSYNGRFRYGVDFTDATIEEVAIRLRGTSASGNVATSIEYDANDYSYYDRANNRYGFVIGGNVPLLITSTGLNLTASGGNPIIDYDSNDYTSYDKTNNRWNMVVGGTVVGGFNAGGVYAGVGAIGNTSAFLNVAASTTSVASIYLPAGSAPSSPVDGQMWRIGAVLYLRDGGTTKSVTFA